MAVTITSDNFDDYFLQSLEQHGAAEETVTTVGVADVPTATLPVIRTINNVDGYYKISVQDLMTTIANMVSTTGLLQAVTEEQFNAIFD